MNIVVLHVIICFGTWVKWRLVLSCSKRWIVECSVHLIHLYPGQRNWFPLHYLPFKQSGQARNCFVFIVYSQYLNLVKSMPSAGHVGRTKLDKERLKLCQYEVESVCQSAQELKGSTKDDGHIKDNLKAANALLQRLLNIAIEVCVFLEYL